MWKTIRIFYCHIFPYTLASSNIESMPNVEWNPIVYIYIPIENQSVYANN